MTNYHNRSPAKVNERQDNKRTINVHPMLLMSCSISEILMYLQNLDGFAQRKESCFWLQMAYPPISFHSVFVLRNT